MITAIVQARMGSRRFPNKVLEDLNGKVVLQYILDTLQELKNEKIIDEFIIATPDTPENEKLWKYLENAKVNYFKGSNNDVLDRYYKCAKENKADVIIRICADVPFIQKWQIAQQIENFKKYGKFTYGNGAWVFSFDELEESWINGKHEEDREHVTNRMFNAIDYPDDLEKLRMMHKSNKIPSNS